MRGGALHDADMMQDDAARIGQRTEPSEWKFDSEGRVDQDEVMRHIQQHVNSATGETAAAGVATRRLSDADISAIRRCLKLPERGS